MTPRPCIDCGEPTTDTRCPSCQADQDRRTDTSRGSRHERGYDGRWARLSARARRLQPWCLDCGATDNLTADHLRWPARTLDDVEVVCGPCNNRRGAARGTRTRGETRKPAGQGPTGQA